MYSVCIIGKNEENNIEKCLKSLQPLQCEIVFTDTGSTDSTIDIVKKYTDKIFTFKWNNNFSDARNYCISKASNDVIINIDCDEVVNLKNLTLLKDLIQKHQYKVGRFCIRNVIDRYNKEFETDEYVSKIFNRKHYQFRGRIHEQIHSIDSNSNTQTYIVSSNILLISHYGYNGADLITKCQRNISLLLEDYSLYPTDAYILYQLGKSYYMLQDYENAYRYFGEGLCQDVDPSLDYVQDMVESYGYTLLNSNRVSEAYQFKNIYDTFAKTADFVFLMGLVYMNNEKYDEAIEEFKKAINIPNHKVKGVNSFLSFYNIGVIYECLGDHTNALIYYKKCNDYPLALQRIHCLTKA